MKKNVSRWIYLCVYVAIVDGMILLEVLSGLPYQIVYCIVKPLYCFVPVIVIYCTCVKLSQNHIKFKDETKKILKEFERFIFEIAVVLFIETMLSYLYSQNVSINESINRETFKNSPFAFAILAVIIGPIIEETIFRYLPYQFIKNKKIYIIVSAFVFSMMHCIGSLNDLIYIPMYLPSSLYFAYKYYKTEDVFVTIPMHSCINFIAIIHLLIQ